MFGVSFLELVVIFGVALIVFGPEKLPELARNLGKIMAQFRRTSDEMRREFYNSVYKPADDFKKQVDLSARNLILGDPLPDPKPKEDTGVPAHAPQLEEVEKKDV